MVSAIYIQIILRFSIANNVVPVEDDLEIRNVDYTLTESERYSARIRYHYIAWALKICLDNLNELKTVFTWMKCFTEGCYDMARADFFKIPFSKIGVQFFPKPTKNQTARSFARKNCS